MNEMKEIAQTISEIGFPIFIALYLVIRQDRLLIKILEELKKFNNKKGEK